MPSTPKHRLAIIATPATAAEPVSAATRAATLDTSLPMPVGVILLDSSLTDAAPDLRIPTLGSTTQLEPLIRRHNLTHALIAIPAPMTDVLARLERSLAALGVTHGRYTPIAETFAPTNPGARRPATVQELDLQALIGRRARATNTDTINAAVSGKAVLITGAGGSIGSEIARICAHHDPAQLILMDRSENSLFEIDRHLAEHHPALARRAVLHDIVDEGATRRRLSELSPDIVFHAAAHKHVPLMQDHPAAAIANNLFGTRSVAKAALHAGAERFILVSTDKAVSPTSVMGATKRMAELTVRSLNAMGQTRFSLVRFGNVLGSACSVLPIWHRQLTQGGPLTITDRRMTRYFMTIPEAAALVIQSASILDHEVFVLDMGEPVNIADLAERFLTAHHLAPAWPGEPTPTAPSVPIHVTGARPGEKLHEELAYSSEELTPTDLPGILAWPGETPDAAMVHAMTEHLATFQTDDPPADVIDAISRWVPISAPAKPASARQTPKGTITIRSGSVQEPQAAA